MLAGWFANWSYLCRPETNGLDFEGRPQPPHYQTSKMDLGSLHTDSFWRSEILAFVLVLDEVVVGFLIMYLRDIEY
jgi:hypothetical protein